MQEQVPALQLADLTEKQREVLSLIADSRTSKEIAGFLGITESAVNQRIEAVRGRLGGVPRAELARLYRQWTAADPLLSEGEQTCNSLTADNFQLTSPAPGADSDGGSQRVAPFPDKASDLDESASPESVPLRVVPPAFDGEHGTLNRLLAMIAVAVGLMALAMVCLGVAQALNRVV